MSTEHDWDREATAAGYSCTCGRQFTSWGGLRTHQSAQSRAAGQPLAVSTTGPRIAINVRSKRKTVTTTRRNGSSRYGQTVQQTHAGYVGIVWVPGERQPRECCDFHQKSKAAKACAARYAREIARETGLPLTPEARKVQP